MKITRSNVPVPVGRRAIRRDRRTWLDRCYDWFYDLIDARFEIDADFDPKKNSREGFMLCVALGAFSALAAWMPW
jgi:hypothetical protein